MSPDGDLRSSAQSQLVADVLDVSVGGPLGNAEPARDIGVCQPVRDEQRHLLLTSGEGAAAV